MSKYDDLVTKLKEIFQIDRPELDFGVYRILSARMGEITDYLENRLKAKVAESLAVAVSANRISLHKELKEKEAQYRAESRLDNNRSMTATRSAGGKVKASGMDPDSVPKIAEIKQKLARFNVVAAEHENAVFTHLLTFFSRYYDKGDFISQRRYKGDTYAIPYAGEEVVLHWANKDQYYTKSGENFSNYAFKLDDGRNVRFRLVKADTAKDNRKDNDKERRFVLIEPHTRTLTDEEGDEYEQPQEPVAEENGELVLRFEYKAMPKGSKQDDLVAQAVKAVLNHPVVKARWLDLASREPTEKNPQRTLLEKCLTNYTAKNSADYFIHKNLGGFLRRELDFYIKNEVMNLDDVQYAETFADIEHKLRMIQTLRSIALDLIAFLAQLEDFQKKLWLKKKFVVATHYCVTLDRVPESLYPLVAANQQQWEQWDSLGILDNNKADLFNQSKVGSVEYLKEHPYLMVDTSLFDATFKYAFLATINNLDKTTDGLLIHGDNLQALNLLNERYNEQIKCIYIDPPYNIGDDGFLFKDSYQHSSWLSMISQRLNAAWGMLETAGVCYSSIDSKERSNLENALNLIFDESNRVEEIIWVQNTTKNQSPTFSTNHEYIEVFAKDIRVAKKDFRMFREPKPGYFEISELIDKLTSQYPEVSIIENNLRDLFKEHRSKLKHSSSNNDDEFDEWKGIYNYNRAEYRDDNGNYVEESISKSKKAKIWVWREDNPSMPQVKADSQKPEFKDSSHPAFRFYKPVHPVTKKECPFPKRGWSWPYSPYGNQKSCFRGLAEDHRIAWGHDETKIPQTKRFLHEVETNVAKSVVNDYTDGEKELANLFGQTRSFSNPKPTTLIARFFAQSASEHRICLDYFAGSGTSGHAVINVNRQDQGNRKYILVEQAEYFETIIKPRIQKVVYSADWKDGKATAPHTGISHAFKVLQIESYEDTLNNLQLRRTQAQQHLLEDLPQSAQEDYLLHYLLDIESRGSLLSVEHFNKPFDCKLKVTVDSAGAYEERSIDLVETFNYLIGLRVKQFDMQMEQGFVLVTGSLPTGEKTLVLWRDVERVDYDRLNRLCDKLAINPADSEFDVVYINGDHNIPAVSTSLESEGGITKTLKIRQIEPEFLSRMFAVESM